MRDTSRLTAESSEQHPKVYAIQGGKITDWDAYEAILDDVIYNKVSRQVQDHLCKASRKGILHA